MSRNALWKHEVTGVHTGESNMLPAHNRGHKTKGDLTRFAHSGAHEYNLRHRLCGVFGLRPTEWRFNSPRAIASCHSVAAETGCSPGTGWSSRRVRGPQGYTAGDTRREPETAASADPTSRGIGREPRLLLTRGVACMPLAVSCRLCRVDTLGAIGSEGRSGVRDPGATYNAEPPGRETAGCGGAKPKG